MIWVSELLKPKEKYKKTYNVQFKAHNVFSVTILFNISHSAQTNCSMQLMSESCFKGGDQSRAERGHFFVPLFQNESSCKTLQMKTSLIYMKESL